MANNSFKTIKNVKNQTQHYKQLFSETKMSVCDHLDHLLITKLTVIFLFEVECCFVLVYENSKVYGLKVEDFLFWYYWVGDIIFDVENLFNVISNNNNY